MRKLIVCNIVSLDGCFGSGARLFDARRGATPRLEQVQAVEAPGVTHIRCRLR
jgi:hypothetical protein